MTEASKENHQKGYEDYPSVAHALRSPRDLTREILAGVVTALALVPEVISFSFIAGVDPRVSLMASVVLGIVMSILGGRPAMVTAAAGSIALVIGPMVREYGVEYVLPAVLLAGLIQLVFGLTGMARIMRFVPRSVMIGFVNALGILIFAAQIPHLLDVPWAVYPLFVLAVAITVFLPRFSTLVPAPLVAIVVVTAIVAFAGLTVPNVGGEGEGAMGSGLPGLTPLLVPLDLQTLAIVWPTAVSIAFVGLLETLLTAKLVDEITDTRSNKGRESWALGLANIFSGFYGGIAGCAMIGQTVVNVEIGKGRTRISTFAAAIVLLLLVTVLSELMAMIPMVVLAAVMMVVALKTIDWQSVSLPVLRRMPVSETVAMLGTVAVTVATGNLAFGVGIGVMLALALFARNLAYVTDLRRTLGADGRSVQYEVHGPLFFGSSNALSEQFLYRLDPGEIVIDMEAAQLWDASSVAVLDAVSEKYRKRGASVSIRGFDRRSAEFHAKLSRLGS